MDVLKLQFPDKNLYHTGIIGVGGANEHLIDVVLRTSAGVHRFDHVAETVKETGGLVEIYYKVFGHDVVRELL